MSSASRWNDRLYRAALAREDWWVANMLIDERIHYGYPLRKRHKLRGGNGDPLSPERQARVLDYWRWYWHTQATKETA